ncbi:hypothetical protein P7K49_003823, partial [Saguinus oedipus]
RISRCVCACACAVLASSRTPPLTLQGGSGLFLLRLGQDCATAAAGAGSQRLPLRRPHYLPLCLGRFPAPRRGGRLGRERRP